MLQLYLETHPPLHHSGRRQLRMATDVWRYHCFFRREERKWLEHTISARVLFPEEIVFSFVFSTSPLWAPGLLVIPGSFVFLATGVAASTLTFFFLSLRPCLRIRIYCELWYSYRTFTAQAIFSEFESWTDFPFDFQGESEC